MITTFSLPLTEVPTCYYFFKTLSRKFSASILSTSRAPGALHSIALSKFSRNNYGSNRFRPEPKNSKDQTNHQLHHETTKFPASLSTGDQLTPYLSIPHHFTDPFLTVNQLFHLFNRPESHPLLTTFTVSFPLGRQTLHYPPPHGSFFFTFLTHVFPRASPTITYTILNFFNYHHFHSKYPPALH